jgi:hypothetical protein
MPAARRQRNFSSRPLSAAVPPKPPVVRRHLMLQDRLDVLDFCELNQDRMSHDDMARVLCLQGYGTVCQTTISRWMKKHDTFRALARNANELSFKCVRQVKHPDVDKALQMWILQMQGCNIRLTRDVVRTNVLTRGVGRRIVERQPRRRR